ADGGVGARGAVGDARMLTAQEGVAAVGGAGVAVVAVGRAPGGAGPADAGLETVAGVAVRAGRPVRHDQVRAHAEGAHVGGARVAVVAVGGHARRADAGLADLVAVADRGVGARRAVEHRGVRAAGGGVAAVGGAGVAVVTVERRPVDAEAGLTDLGAVADG